MSESNRKLLIENIRSLNNADYAVLSMLYAPLIKESALALFHLYNALVETKSALKNERFILETLRWNQGELLKQRKILEQFLLIRSFEDEENNLLIKVQPPKSGVDFLKHEVFGRLYSKEMGQQMYEFANLCFASSNKLNENYEEISEPFKMSVLTDWKDKEEEHFKAIKPLGEVSVNFNFDLVSFLNNCSSLAFPLGARNEETLKEIKELGSIYGVDEKAMILLVARSMDLRSNKLNINRLKSRILNAYQPKVREVENPYELSPIEFLCYKQGGVPVVGADKKIIEDLVRVMKLPDIVVNVLVEYVLKMKNQKLDRSYIEKIAGNWVRLKIDSYDKAIAQCTTTSESKGKKVTTSEKKKLPEWYNKADEEVVDENFDMDEFEKKMAKLRGE